MRYIDKDGTIYGDGSDFQDGWREATQEEIAAHLAKTQKEQINIRVQAQIEELEKQAHRPLRELQLDGSNEYAKNKLAEIDAKIIQLRGQLI